MVKTFNEFASKFRGSPVVLWAICACAFLFIIGVIFFIEDTKSSRDGITLIEIVFGVKPVNYAISYWAMSLAPQVAQIVFMYLFLVNPRKNWWALIIVGVFFSMDFISDVQDRSNQHLFPITGGVNLDMTVFVASILTLIFFTVGSELFITVSVGLILLMLADAIVQFGKLRADIGKSRAESQRLAHGSRRDNVRKSNTRQVNRGQPVREEDMLRGRS